MKKIILITFLLISFLGYSQMPAAKMTPPDCKDEITINKPAQEVYVYLNDFDAIADFGSDIIKKSTTLGKGRTSKRTLVFKNDDQREEEIAILADDEKKIGIQVLNYDDKFSRYFYYYEVNEKNKSSCTVTMKAYYEAKNKDENPEIKASILSEFETLLKGLKEKLEKS